MRTRSRARWAATGAVVLGFAALGLRMNLLRRICGGLIRIVPILLFAVVVVVVAATHRRRVSETAHRRSIAAVVAGPAGFAGSCVLFLSASFAGWANGRGPFVIGGQVPVTDAALYLGGAQRLLFDGRLDGWNGRRPLNALFLAARLGATGLDLHVALLVQAIVLAAACYLAARAVAIELGLAAGLAVFTGLFAYSYPFAANPLSEAMGVAMGALAFAAIWTGAHQRNVALAAAGLALTAVAQGFRPSSVLLPVGLCVLLAVALRRSGRIDVRIAAVGAVALVAGLSASLAGSLIGRTEITSLGGSAGYSIYGLARGGPSWAGDGSRSPSWTLIYVDHGNEILPLPEARRTPLVNRLALEQVLEHPRRFAKTYVLSERNFAGFAWANVARPLSGAGSAGLGLAFALAAAAGLVRRRASSVSQLITDAVLVLMAVAAIPLLIQTWADRPVFSAAGLLLAASAIVAFGWVGAQRLSASLPTSMVLVTAAVLLLELPVLGVDNVRVFAAISPYFTLPLALSAAILSHRPMVRLDGAGESTRVGGWPPVMVGAAVLATALVGGPLAMAWVKTSRPSSQRCPAGGESEVITVGSTVKFVDHPVALDETGGSVPPAATSPFFVDFGRLMFQNVTGVHRPLTAVAGLTQTGDDGLYFLAGEVTAAGGDVLQVCGTRVSGFIADALRDAYPLPTTFEVRQGVALKP